jgi:hypothetical protein
LAAATRRMGLARYVPGVLGGGDKLSGSRPWRSIRLYWVEAFTFSAHLTYGDKIFGLVFRPATLYPEEMFWYVFLL